MDFSTLHGGGSPMPWNVLAAASSTQPSNTAPKRAAGNHLVLVILTGVRQLISVWRLAAIYGPVSLQCV